MALASNVMPTILTSNNRLRYYEVTKEQKIPKKDCKAYLDSVVQNAQILLHHHKQD